MIDASSPMLAPAAILLTLVAYGLALWLYRRVSWGVLLPVLTGSSIVVCTLMSTGISYGTYRQGAGALAWLAGPATVALALPLHRQRARLQGIWLPVMGALLAGSVTAIISAIGIAWLMGADWSMMMSLAPKSATMPVAMPVAQRMGGMAPLAAVSVVLTGISTVVASTGVFGLLALGDDRVRGFALGATGHALGTVRAFQLGETAVAFSALGMGLNAIATSMLVPLIVGML